MSPVGPSGSEDSSGDVLFDTPLARLAIGSAGVVDRLITRTQGQVALGLTLGRLVGAKAGLPVHAPVVAMLDRPRLHPVRSMARSSNVTPLRPTDRLSAVGPSSDVGASQVAVAEEPAASEQPPVPTSDELAIPSYDELAASQVVKRLPGLDAAELAAIGTYERAPWTANDPDPDPTAAVHPVTDALQVRPIGDADVAGVVDLLEQAHRHQLEQRDGEMWATVNAVPVTEERACHRAEHGLVLVGTVLGVPVGVVVARHEVVSDKRLALIEELYTEPEARGVGVGRRLIQAVELWARATGCIGIESMALPGDRDTKNFFEAAGLIARAIVVHRSFEPTR